MREKSLNKNVKIMLQEDLSFFNGKLLTCSKVLFFVESYTRFVKLNFRKFEIHESFIKVFGKKGLM